MECSATRRRGHHLVLYANLVAQGPLRGTAFFSMLESVQGRRSQIMCFLPYSPPAFAIAMR